MPDLSPKGCHGEAAFLSFVDRCIEDDPSLVVPADEAQLERLGKLLGVEPREPRPA